MRESTGWSSASNESTYCTENCSRARSERDLPTPEVMEKYKAARERLQKVRVHTDGIRCLSDRLDLDAVGRLEEHLIEIELLLCSEMSNPIQAFGRDFYDWCNTVQ